MTFATFERLDVSAVLLTVSSMTMFSTALQALLPISEIALLERHASWSAVPKGEVLVRRGAAGRSLVLVVSGSVIVERSGIDPVHLTASPGNPIVLGELTLLSHKLFRTATATTSSDAVVMTLAGSRWDRLVAKLPVLHEYVAANARVRRQIDADVALDDAKRSFENYQAYLSALDKVNARH
jgi:CRP-like cAMP-binding protein